MEVLPKCTNFACRCVILLHHRYEEESPACGSSPSEGPPSACGSDTLTPVVPLLMEYANATLVHWTKNIIVVEGRSVAQLIHMLGSWGTICDDHWTLVEASVACRSLGFPGARTAYSAAYFGSGSGPIWLDDTFCDGMPEYFLFICSRVVQNQLNEAAEECLRMFWPCVWWEVAHPCVEVNYNGQGWGTVCDDGWILEDAGLVCRMLGYSSAANATRAAYFGQGVGPVWLDEVLCSGGEQSLLECSHSEVGAHNCRHSEDAGVICSSEYLN
ncbi:hypothetical protein EMCRGX_G016375 [Ephydatia muelleri]